VSGAANHTTLSRRDADHASAGSHLDAPWPCLVASGNRQPEHTITQLRVDARGIDVGAQHEGPEKMWLAYLRVLQPQL